MKPSGVVTFLFTDIEGSTRRWEADAESMRTALLAHDRVLRTVIESHNGFLFSRTGDGVVAAFASPKSAVEAAIDAQRELQLPVRMGIATGEAELRDGDYFGTVLNRAARVMAAGHGGQILVADSAAVLLDGVELQNLGPRRLRDVPNPINVFQLKAPGLPTDFPPLRTPDASSGNLRPAATYLIGRDDEVADVEKSLRTHRLVTLTGVGGVGKTRLALEVAARVADEFPDGVWVFELAAVADPDAVPDAVAAVLGITQQPGKTASESVASALDGRIRLLVLDNCEHVLDAAADLVEAIRAASASVKILATSREGLGIADEQVWPVRSLDADAAVEMFIERAHSVGSRFSPHEIDAVGEICRRLDGIPLAVELAASRMASMTAVEVRDRLDDRFKLLTSSRRGLERHHTLRQAIAWSYDLLDDAEKVLLERCSVFAGGFNLQSACAVSESSDDFATLDVLDALVRKSLLITDRSADVSRYSMLETIRQFAEDQSTLRGSADEIRRAHALHFANCETEVLALWDSSRQREAYVWFNTELANLRTAFRWAVDHGDLDAAATIATYTPLLGMLVENYEPATWAEEVIEPARAIGHPRLAALYVMASQCYNTGRVDDAIRICQSGWPVVESAGDTVPFGIHGFIGTVFITVGQPERWVDLCRALLVRCRDTHTFTRACLVYALIIAGRGDEAMAASEGLIDDAEATGNPYAIANALLAHGFAFRNTDPTHALAALRRALAISQDNGISFNESHLAVVLSGLEAEHGDPHAALNCFTLAIRNYQDSGNVTMIRSPLAVLATFFDRLGHYEPAATIAGFAVNPLTPLFTEIDTAIAHLRSVLGERTYEELARKGETMSASAIAMYALDEIDEVRVELERLR